MLFIAVVDEKDGTYKNSLDEEGRHRREQRMPRYNYYTSSKVTFAQFEYITDVKEGFPFYSMLP